MAADKLKDKKPQDKNPYDTTLADIFGVPSIDELQYDKDLDSEHPLRSQQLDVGSTSPEMTDLINAYKENKAEKSQQFIKNMLEKSQEKSNSKPFMVPTNSEAPQTQSFSNSIKTILKTKSPVSAPIASKATREEGMGEVTPAVDPYKDAEMEAALEEAKQNRVRQLYAQAGRQFSEGLGTLGAGKQVDIDQSLEDTLAKSAENPVSDLTNLRKSNLQKIQLREEAEKSDPKSPVSVAMRVALEEMGVKLPENANYATMEKLAPQLMKNKEFQMRMQEMSLKREELEQSKLATAASKQDERLLKVRENLLKSERYKQLLESQNALKAARSNLELAKQGHSQGYSALGANLAKLAGEKGMLSEADVNRYLVEKGIPGRVQQGIFQTTGKPTKIQLQGLENILSTLEADLHSRGQQFAEDELSGYSSGLKVQPESIERVLPEIKRLHKAEPSQSVDADAKKYAEMHKMSYEQAKAILDKRRGVK